MNSRTPHLLAAISGLIFPQFASGIVSSNGGSNPPYSGININHFLGADRFYTKGYSGSGAIIANIEAGHLWNEHETLTHVNTYIKHAEAKGDFDRHATAVGFTLGGRVVGDNPGEFQRGIADGAELWSGAIATSWTGTPYTTNFTGSLNSHRYPYYTAMIDGMSGQTSDVVNSSWATGTRDNSYLFGRKLDAMVNASAKTLVFIAGNAGATADPRVAGAGANFNNITVAALGNDTSSPPYNSRAAFSSYGPNGFWNPATQTIVPGVLASVDLAAPGTNITRAFYGGATGGNLGGTPIPGSNLYLEDGSGTTFAAAIVSGGAALVVDAGKALHGGGSAIDGRVVKSVLQNSASKTAGWDNGQSPVGGVITTTRSLDYSVGAGRMNLSQAFSQCTVGTANVPGNGGGDVLPIGWDFGQVAEGSPNDYLFTAPLLGGSTLTATLNWFIDNTYDYATDLLVDRALHNLDLEVWKVTGGTPDAMVATSKSIYNNVEHLHFELPETADYMLRVKWIDKIFDTVAVPNAEWFGLSWAAVPSPVQWNVDAGGNWSADGNWSGLVPGVPGATVNFTVAITEPRMVSVDGPRTVGHIVFDNANSYSLVGSGMITLQTFGGESSISVMSGEHSIAAPVDLQSSTMLDVAAGSRLTLSGPMTSAAMHVTLTKAGEGVADVSRVRAEKLVLDGGELRVLPNGTAAATSTVRSLAIAQSGALQTAAARLDLTNNAMVIDYDFGSPSPLSMVREWIREGHASGAWAGHGITTSHGDGSQFGIGYGEALALATVPSIFGDVDSTAVLLRFSRYGDANLDGVVNLADFNALASNFGGSGAFWNEGDFNYDSLVNLADFNLLAANFGLAASAGGPTPDDWAALAAAVPESSLGAACAIVPAALLRRRRKASLS